MILIKHWIDEASVCCASAPYLQDAAGTRELTFADLRHSTGAWSRRLDQAGVAPGARVAIRCRDPLDYASALVAILGAGRVVVPLDPGAPASALARVLDAARPQALVGDGGPPPDMPLRRLPVLSAPSTREAEEIGDADGTLDAGGILLCTSGTTGAPKGVLLHERQLSHVAAAVASHHRLTPADRGYCCLPLYHVNAEVVGLLATLAARAHLVLDRRFSPREFWAMIEEHDITWINAVPAIITILAGQTAAVQTASRLRFVRSASAPLPPAALRQFEQRFGVPVIETYGMTEAASMITANPLDGPRKPGSAGLPAGAAVRIIQRKADGTGERSVPCPPGTVGRVQIRGAGVITEYTAGGSREAIDADGWLDTGDVGHLDADGYLFLAGRSDDVINRGGEKIYPREIEEFLLGQPGVRSAAVVGARDGVLGQRPVAYVVSARAARPSQLADALRRACEAGLPRPKRPSAIHLVRKLPLGATGKVARGRLRELATAQDNHEPGAAA